MGNYCFAEGEVLLINKPLNWTSFDVVSKIRNTLKPLKLKVGHAGTLDPLATGLLIVCTGKLTKKIDEFQAQTKVYTGSMFLGATTPSFDMETDVEQVFSVEKITQEHIVNACQNFIGTIEQTPPIHSAVKQNGERLYEKARRGEIVTIKKRMVHIENFRITSIDLPTIGFEVTCSKGTYIRSLVNDYGKSLDNGAYLQSLCRTQIGNFSVNNAKKIEEWVAIINNKKEEGGLK